MKKLYLVVYWRESMYIHNPKVDIILIHLMLLLCSNSIIYLLKVKLVGLYNIASTIWVSFYLKIFIIFFYKENKFSQFKSTISKKEDNNENVDGLSGNGK